MERWSFTIDTENSSENRPKIQSESTNECYEQHPRDCEDPTLDHHKPKPSQSSELSTNSTLLDDVANCCWKGQSRSVRLMLPKSVARTPCDQAYWMLKALLKIVRSSSSSIRPIEKSASTACYQDFHLLLILHLLRFGSEELQTPADTHQCTFCYIINSRLFVAPLDAQTACPVCKMPKSEHHYTE